VIGGWEVNTVMDEVAGMIVDEMGADCCAGGSAAMTGGGAVTGGRGTGRMEED
jgi:hypothetical protein